jgi:hypothetical protein
VCGRLVCSAGDVAVTPETLLPGHQSTAGSVQEQRGWSDVSTYERVSNQLQDDIPLFHIRELFARHALLAAVPEVSCADDEDKEQWEAV